MSIHLSRARFAATLAVVAALFVSGLVVGAAGDPLILGSLLNNSGASATKLTTSVNGNGFAVSQTGAGASANGIRGDANTGTGGVFTSTSNNALFASVASGNRFAMVAVNSGTAGTGGAIAALGNANPGLVVDVDSNSVDPIEVNSTSLVDNLNADLLDGRHANSLVRFAYAFDNDNALVGVSGTVLSTTIEAPTRGFLHIVASSDVFGSAADQLDCSLDVDGTNIAASLRTFFLGTDNLEENCSTNAGYLTCGGTHTVSLEAGVVAATTTFDEATLEVTFMPFNGTGGTVPNFNCLIPLSPSADYSPTNGITPE